ncbi:hypothetical protein FRC06_001965 [Ceratobasidium sp. 370]|nr:hypothetical protein FRC06_001965 [Ceratobasidium sp. 370]
MQRKKQPIVDPSASASAPPTRTRFQGTYNAPLTILSTPASPCLPSPLPLTVSFLALPLANRSSARAPRTPSETRSSHCQEMLRTSLARDERTARRSTFDASYSPPASSSSSCSQRSLSPEPRAPTTRRTSLPRSNTVSHPRCVSHTLPRSQTHPTDLSAHATLSRPCNEDILRSRLEGVLSSASSSRDVSCPPSPQRRRGDSLTFGLITPPHGLLPPPPMSRSRTSPAISRSSRPSTTSPSPITPPPSPPFDANRIALQLRDREGYVSFADVQGLGVPHDADEDDVDPERGRGRWWSLWKG